MSNKSGSKTYIVLISALSFFAFILNLITLQNYLISIFALLFFTPSFLIHSKKSFEKVLEDYVKNTLKRDMIKNIFSTITILSITFFVFCIAKFAINVL